MGSCQGCENRHVGCHADCEIYKEWCEEQKKLRDKDKSYRLWKSYIAYKAQRRGK